MSRVLGFVRGKSETKDVVQTRGIECEGMDQLRMARFRSLSHGRTRLSVRRESFKWRVLSNLFFLQTEGECFTK